MGHLLRKVYRAQCMTTEAEVYEAPALRVVTTHGGARCYYNAAGQLHRSTGPAVEWPNGDQVWVCKGLRHRIDGPAVVSADDIKSGGSMEPNTPRMNITCSLNCWGMHHDQ